MDVILSGVLKGASPADTLIVVKMTIAFCPPVV